MRRSAGSGFTLLELLLVLALLAILTGMAAPRLHGYLERARLRGVLDRFTADLYQARALAARSGERVLIRFVPGPDGCAERYQLLHRDPERVLREVDLRSGVPGHCLTISGSPTVHINSRGLPSGAARTVRVRSPAGADSLTISMVGRVYRR